ncbi:MAG: hypothetical protein GX446_17675 [Chthonomonadales bacterium]|nr:hypothetical protein [Chthonomonadales bacterium]
MRRTLVVLGAAALVMASTSMAFAQGPGGPGGPGGRQGGMMGGRMGMMGGGLGLLRIPEVQQELKMTQPQIAKLDGAQQALQESMRELMQGAGGFQQMSQEEREKLMAKGEELQDKAVAGILDQTQLKRYKELSLQRQGAMALMRPSVAKELGITEEQRQKMQQIQQDQMAQMRQMFQRGQGGGFQQMTPEERQQRMQQLREAQEKAQAAMLNVLNAQQKAKWAQMTGKPFKFPEMGFGAGRRGGNRPGGAGGPGGQPPL